MFTTSTITDRAYASKRDNVTLEEKLLSSPAIAVVAGVSAERGLEAFFLQPRSIDSDAFIQYLLTLLQHSPSSEFALFVDNCRVHHSIKVGEFMKDNKILAIFNVPYGPEFNPIERVWSRIKTSFKKERLSEILEGNSPDYTKLVRRSMLSCSNETICSICRKTMRSKLDS